MAWSDLSHVEAHRQNLKEMSFVIGRELGTQECHLHHRDLPGETVAALQNRALTTIARFIRRLYRRNCDERRTFKEHSIIFSACLFDRLYFFVRQGHGINNDHQNV